jgi:dTDP-glucose 4,6-dehydratase
MRLMHILVTGGSGFIGSNFIRYWRRTHPHDFITNLDALTYAGNPANLVDIAQDSAHYRFIQGSITDPAVVHDAFEGVDVVVHFAAESHVDRSILGSKAFFETNVEGICLNAVQQHELEERTITNWTIASRITTDHFFVRSLYHMLDLNLRYAIDI